MQDQDILAAHIKDSYGNFTLPKLFIDVRGLTFVAVTKKSLVSGEHLFEDWPVHQTVGNFRMLGLLGESLDPLVLSRDPPTAETLGSTVLLSAALQGWFDILRMMELPYE